MPYNIIQVVVFDFLSVRACVQGEDTKKSVNIKQSSPSVINSC